MEAYDNILMTRIIGMSIVLFIGLVVVIVSTILIKKFDVPKYVYVLPLILLVVGCVIVFDSVVPMAKDVQANSYITYTGEFECTNRGSSSRVCSKLLDGSDTIVYSTRGIMIESGNTYIGKIIYGEHSHIVVDIELFD